MCRMLQAGLDFHDFTLVQLENLCHILDSVILGLLQLT